MKNLWRTFLKPKFYHVKRHFFTHFFKKNLDDLSMVLLLPETHVKTLSQEIRKNTAIFEKGLMKLASITRQ